MKARSASQLPYISLIVLLATACASRRPPTPIEHYRPLTATTEDLLDIVRTLAARGSEWTTRADLVFEDLKTGRSRSVGIRFAARKPAHLRMQGTKTLLPTIFTLVSNEDGVWLDVPRKHKVYHLPAGASVPPGGDLANSLLSLRPADLLSAIVPDPPASEEIWTIRERPEHYVLSAHLQEGGDLVVVRDLRFDRRSLQLVEALLYDATGRLLTSTTITPGPGTAVVPERVRILRPYDNVALTFEFDEARSAELKESVFRFRQPKGRELVDVSDPEHQQPIPLPDQTEEDR